MLRIAVFVSGGGSNLQAILDSIEEGRITNAEVSVVISNKKDVYALERGRKAGIASECISPKDYDSVEGFEQALLQVLAKEKVDFIVLAGFLVILPKGIIEVYRDRIINIHPSLIPSYCGAGYYGLRVHEAVLKRGNKITGATVHFVDEGTDTGPIILQKAVPVEDNDTPETLQKRVMEHAEWTILPEAINLYANHRIKIENQIVKRVK